jgi:hypothetical protein
MKKTILFFTMIACNFSGFSQSPMLSISQPTCFSPFGTVEVISPLSNAGPTAQNLYISEVTDADLGGLSYIEIYNGTGAAVDLSNYKLKTYLNGSANSSCDLTLSGLVNTSNVFVVAIGSVTNLGGVTPNLTFAACTGFNTNDAVVLTTINNVAIDLWGATDGTVFTPLGQSGYTYRRHVDAPVPSLTWNAADWDALGNEDYSNVGIYSTSVNYQYSLDEGAYQSSTFFSQVALGNHVITAQNIATGATEQTSFDIMPMESTIPVTNFIYPPVVCNTNPLIPITPPNFTTGGLFFGTQPLVIDAVSGIINLAQTPPGNYLITYMVNPDLALCMNGGSYTLNLIIQARSPMPQGNANQTLTMSNPTLMNLVVFPTNVTWYESYTDALNLTNPLLDNNTPLVDGLTYYAVNNNGGCPSDPFPVTVNLSLSAASFTGFSFEIVPNPVNASLTFQTTNNLIIDQIIIRDLTGKTVIPQTTINNNQVQVEQLTAGIYLIEGTNGDQKFQSKFIKQ